MLFWMKIHKICTKEVFTNYKTHASFKLMNGCLMALLLLPSRHLIVLEVYFIG